MKRFVGIYMSLALLCFYMALLLPNAGGEEKRDRMVDVDTLSMKPIEITANELVAENQKNRVVFRGKVEAKQNGLTITADKVVAEYGRDGQTVERIKADGDVHVIQEGLREARGDHGTFVNRLQTVELRGNTVVTEGDSKLTGNSLVIYIAENRSVIEGGEEGRVRAVINPEKFLKEKKDGEK